MKCNKIQTISGIILFAILGMLLVFSIKLVGLNGEDEEDNGDNEDKKAQVKQLVVGEDYFLVLYDDGTVWSWGNNAEGKLGIDESFLSQAQKIERLERVVKLEDGGLNVFALTEQGDVYTWGRKMDFIDTWPSDYYGFLKEPMKLEDLKEIVNITAKNNKLYAMNSKGELYAPNDWEKGYVLTFSQEQNTELFGKIDRMFAGTGNYDYFVRTDGTVFTIMEYYFNGGRNEVYAFIFPHEGDITLAEEDILLAPPRPEGLPEITVLDGYYRAGCLVYYNLAGVDGIDTLSSDPYTVFLSKEDGTLCYWNSDRIKYHDSKFALTDPDTLRERCNGNFEEISLADVLEMDSDASEMPRVISMQSGKENTMFLTDDGQVFISRYETYEVADVLYGRWQVPNPGRNSNLATYTNMHLKELVFHKLELTDIESIWTNGENCFCAVDRAGGCYRIIINDKELTQVYQDSLEGEPEYSEVETKSLSEEQDLPSIWGAECILEMACDTYGKYATQDDIEHIGQLTHLKRLKIIIDESATDVSPLGNLAELESLTIDFYGDRSPDLSILENMGQLENLKIRYLISQDDIAHVGQLARLKCLTVKVDDKIDLSPLGNLAELESLTLDFYPDCSPDLSFLENLGQLEELKIDVDDPLDLSPIGSLSQLKRLSIESFYIWSPDTNNLSFLKKLDQLENVFLYGCEIEDLSLFQNMPCLQKLDVSSVDDCDLNCLADLKNLEDLSIHGKNVRNSEGLGNLTRLKDLYLIDYDAGARHGETKSVPFAMQPIANLTELKGITMENIYIEDISPLADIKRLRYIYLVDTQVGDISPLKNLEDLSALCIYGNESELVKEQAETYFKEIEHLIVTKQR